MYQTNLIPTDLHTKTKLRRTCATRAAAMLLRAQRCVTRVAASSGWTRRISVKESRPRSIFWSARRPEEGQALARAWSVPYAECSAKEGAGTPRQIAECVCHTPAIRPAGSLLLQDWHRGKRRMISRRSGGAAG